MIASISPSISLEISNPPLEPHPQEGGVEAMVKKPCITFLPQKTRCESVQVPNLPLSTSKQPIQHLAQVKWRSIGLYFPGLFRGGGVTPGVLGLELTLNILLVLRCLCEKGRVSPRQTQIPSSTGSFKPMKLSKGPPVSPHARGHVKWNTELKCLNRQHTLRGAGNRVAVCWAG